MSTLQIRAIIAAVVVLFLTAAFFLVRGRIAADARNELTAKIQKQQIKATGQAIEISSKIDMRVQVEQLETAKNTKAAQDKIDEIIEAKPAEPDPFGAVLVDDADLPDVLRIAQQAHSRAVLASCRVQRTSDCPADPGASEQH